MELFIIYVLLQKRYQKDVREVSYKKAGYTEIFAEKISALIARLRQCKRVIKILTIKCRFKNIEILNFAELNKKLARQELQA